MHDNSIPFTIQLNQSEGRIVLSGDLDGSQNVREACENAAKEALKIRLDWAVDARQARLPQGGVELWIAVVREFLHRAELEYLPSQLAMNLEYDDQYTHKNSTFLETMPTAGCATGCHVENKRRSVIA